MKVHELSKKSGKSNKDICEEFGLKSHLSVVPDDVVEMVLDKGDAGNSIIKKIEREEAEAMRLAEEKKLAAVVQVEDTPIVEPVNINTVTEVHHMVEAVVEAVVEVDPDYEKAKELSIRCLGNKSPYWKK